MPKRGSFKAKVIQLSLLYGIYLDGHSECRKYEQK